MNRETRATRALIHLDSLRSNLRTIRQNLPPLTPVCAAVKANAYGHGVIPVSRLLRKEGVEALGVATPFEGEELRESGDKDRIILFSPTAPDEVPVTVRSGLEPMVSDLSYLDAIEREVKAVAREEAFPVHLKIDTGMGRVGCRPEEAPALAARIAESPLLSLAGTATHFPVADSDSKENLSFTGEQVKIFEHALEAIRKTGINPGTVHAANSGSIALSPENAFGMVRPGISLYGYGMPIPKAEPWQPVMELRTRITALKKVRAGTSISYGRTWTADTDTWIATLSAGYGDGYTRLFSNTARVMIKEKSYPIVGRICMDQCMVNLGEDTDIALYDEAILFGPDSRGPDAEELAELIGTISYEITCSISARVPRIYVD